MGRETALDPFTWTQDGWPLLNQGRGVSTLNRLPLAPAPFAQEKTDWLTSRPPKAGEIVWQGESVTITGSEYPMEDVRCRSLTLRRQTDFACTFSAVLTVPKTGEAGITGYYDEYSFYAVGVQVKAQEVSIVVTERIGHETRVRYRQIIDAAPGDRITLSTQANGLVRNVSWAKSKACTQGLVLRNVTYLSDEGVTVSKRFTGAMLGMYALYGCKAQFDTIRYAEGMEAEA